MSGNGDKDWQGKVVLITGGNGGMGRAIAARFRQAGASIAVADLGLAEIAPDVFGVKADVTKVADCGRMVEETVARFGRLDVLICAAGV